jgi:hypothetical protein
MHNITALFNTVLKAIASTEDETDFCAHASWYCSAKDAKNRKDRHGSDIRDQSGQK